MGLLMLLVALGGIAGGIIAIVSGLAVIKLLFRK